MGGSTKLLGVLNPPWQGFEKKNFTKIEAHAGMAERLVRYLAVEEALQEEIKHTLEHNNQSYGELCAQKYKRKQDKCLSNHHFPLRLPQKTKHHSGETQYAALIWYSINFQWVSPE